MKIKNFFRSAIAMLLVVVMVLSIVACGEKNPDDKESDTSNNGGDTADKTYTYNTYLTLSPSNWNMLTYKDANDTEIMDWLASNLFSYDFKFDENGEIVSGEYEVKYGAASKLEDVTSQYVGEKWGISEGAKGYAYKITLREDLKWEDGTPITAADFVYSMQEQLNPLFQNYRADSYYAGSTVIVNAENYVKQGQSLMVDNGASSLYSAVSELVKGDDGVYTQPDGKAVYFSTSTALAQCSGYTIEALTSMGYFETATYEALKALEGEDGYISVTDESIALIETLINVPNWGNEGPENVPLYFVCDYAYPEVDWADVGYFVGDTDYELVMILVKPLALLKDDGSLSYKASYNMSSLPLVHKETYEKCKIAPSEGETLWTSNYCSSVETTKSWGPYKLESFQSGTQYVLTRNETWYGYGLEENANLYQTDRIVCDIVKDWNAAWVMFLAGEIDGIGIDVSIADDYKGSDRAYFTPSDYVMSLQLQSGKEALKARETDGVNKSILAYSDFRKALSLAINRADFATKTTTSSLQGFGLFNTMHYYDVENGGVYRNTDEAKKVLCEIYNVDYTKYDSLDKAVDAITGYDLDAAKELVTKAYNEALAAGDIKETDKVVLTMGTGAINTTVTRRFDFMTEAWKELVKGTPLEGRLETETKDYGDAWADDFRAGDYDVCMGGWQGAAWDPGYFLMAYLSDSYMYSYFWDTESVEMTFTMVGVAEDGGDITETMSLMDWWRCLNGDSSAKYDWSETGLEQSKRLQLIAALEKEVLQAYYTVPVANSFSASLISFKLDYITYEYNTFMAYGGIKYAKYNFDDEAWAAEVAKYNGELNYK